MSLPSDRREDLLDRLLRSELAPDSPEARAAFREDPGLEADYRWIREAEGALDAGVAFERAVLDEALADARPEDETFVHDVLARHRDPAPAPRGGALRARWLQAAAAVLLVALPIAWFATRPPALDDGPPVPDTLGAPVFDLEPSGDVDDFARFTWRGDLPAGGSYEVVVRDADGNELARSPRLEEPRWEPGPPSAGWPDELQWEVMMFDGTDRWVGSQAERCSRSSRSSD